METNGLYTAGTVHPAPVRRALPAQLDGSCLRAMCSGRLLVQGSTHLRAMCNDRLLAQGSAHLRAMCNDRLLAQKGGRIPAQGICGSSHGDSLPQNKRSSPGGRSGAGRPVSRRAPGKISNPGRRAGLGNRRVQGGRAVTSVHGETCSV